MKQYLRQMTDLLRRPGRSRIFLITSGLMLSIAALGIVDLILDGPGYWLRAHFLVEVAFVGVCLGSAVYLGWQWLRSEGSLLDARKALRQRGVERDEWRAMAESFLRGLGEAIDAQMESWNLTPTEKDTALFILKGYTHKEIAQLCDRSERTVRQHAVSVYKKSGLSGRAELSAFFLEDLLLPGSVAGNISEQGNR